MNKQNFKPNNTYKVRIYPKSKYSPAINKNVSAKNAEEAVAKAETNNNGRAELLGKVVN